MPAVSERKYYIDFFQLTITSTPTISTLEDGFSLIVNNEINTVLSLNSYTYDLWGVKNRTNSFAGQLRKFRTEDLELASPNEESEPLELGDKGLVEKNYFVYYREHQLLAWCRNGHGSTARQLGQFLKMVWGTNIEVVPVIKADSMKRLMNNQYSIKRIEATIPRPTNPDLYDPSDYSNEVMHMLNSSGADTLKLQLGINTRRLDSNRSLADTVKYALRDYFNMGATTAKAIVIEEGIEHPIDLIADRIFSIQTIETNGIPPAGTLYGAIDDARDECREDLNEYFGEGENSL